MITAYFDHALDSNLFEHSVASDGSTYWLVAHDRGIAARAELENFGIRCAVTNDYEQPGIYIVDVNGGPALWTGQARLVVGGVEHVTPNILDLISESVVEAMRAQKLKLVLLAWAEGHRFVSVEDEFKIRAERYFHEYDAFEVIYHTALRRRMPLEQIIIVHGNHRVQQEYQQWCQQRNQPPRLNLLPGLKFSRVFEPQAKSNSRILVESAMANPESRCYNSLNRIVKIHRNDHFYELIRRGLLDAGHVSGQIGDYHTPQFIGADLSLWFNTVRNYFPRYIDIKNFDVNPADNFNPWIYENSLLTVITETHFDHDVTFLSEKIFKPISAGHPFLVLGNFRTLEVLKSLGFKTEFCGLETAYDLEANAQKRFDMVHELLDHWVNLPRATKINLVSASLPDIQHNFELYRRLDLNRELFNAIQRF